MAHLLLLASGRSHLIGKNIIFIFSFLKSGIGNSHGLIGKLRFLDFLPVAQRVQKSIKNEVNSFSFYFFSPATGGAGVKVVPQMSPSRRSGMSIPSSVGNIPALSPIQGSPNKVHEPQVQGAEGGFNMPDRAVTVPENLSSFHDADKNRDLQLVSGRNVVLNYGGHSFDRSNSWGNLSRRSQTFAGLAAAGKENTAPITGLPAALLAMPPPALCEETLMAPEHNEILAKLKYISALVDKIIEVARHKAAPLSAIGDTVTAMRKTNPDKQNSGSSGSTELDPNSPHHRRLQQLLLYMRCLHILSQTLDLSRAELKAKKLKPSTSVKNSKLLSYHIFGMRPS